MVFQKNNELWKLKKSRVAWNKGKKHSDKTKEKIRQKMIGKRWKLSHKKKLSEEHKRKIAEKSPFQRGHVSWSKGKTGLYKHSEERKKKIGNAHRGKKLSEEIKRKISEAKKGRRCSPKTEFKRGEMPRGKNHPSWKGGITPLHQRIRHCFKYRQWRSDVFTGDNFTCQVCEKRGGDLMAHHIKEFSLIIEENKVNTLEKALSCSELWNINNGLTLCKRCHKHKHSKNGAI